MKLLIHNNTHKFLNNILHTQIDNVQTYLTKLDGDLYSLYYQHKFDYMIFSFSELTNEILQFISEFGYNHKIFIYHDKNPDDQFINSYQSVCRNLIHEKFINNNMPKNTISIPNNLLNDQIFLPSGENKLDQMVCFLDGLSEIPDELEFLLYPNTRNKIKLFNNNNIKHHQNLGILSEIDKAKLLNISKYYISINGDYSLEATVCNCIVLDTTELSDMIPKKYDNISADYKTYHNFIIGNIL